MSCVAITVRSCEIRSQRHFEAVSLRRQVGTDNWLFGRTQGQNFRTNGKENAAACPHRDDGSGMHDARAGRDLAHCRRLPTQMTQTCEARACGPTRAIENSEELTR